MHLLSSIGWVNLNWIKDNLKTVLLYFLHILALYWKILTKSRKKTNNNSDRKDAEIQTLHTLSQQWKIKSFSRLENGSFSSHSISSAWRSPSVAGCSETEGHNWPWAQTVRWVRTIQPYIISLSQQSKETLTEIKGRIGTGLKGWGFNKCRVWVDGTRQK